MIEMVVERSGKMLEPQQRSNHQLRRGSELGKKALGSIRIGERSSGVADGRFGYLYVERMMWDEFENFEREIYAVGAGKDGIVIDVSDNGGGFTADHLLTVLTPPEHAVTVPRGGGMGYPGDRRVYGTWSKPIVVLCNQNSFSNAEIFAHAVKVLGRGKLVGVPTAGGVISTGAASIMDIGTLRMPFRGWFKSDDGEDMELNGAQPDIVIWPRARRARRLGSTDSCARQSACWRRRSRRIPPNRALPCAVRANAASGGRKFCFSLVRFHSPGRNPVQRQARGRSCRRPNANLKSIL